MKDSSHTSPNSTQLLAFLWWGPSFIMVVATGLDSQAEQHLNLSVALLTSRSTSLMQWGSELRPFWCSIRTSRLRLMVLDTAEECGGPYGTQTSLLSPPAWRGRHEPGRHERPQSKSSLFSPLGFVWSFLYCLWCDLHVSTISTSSLPCAEYGVAHWEGHHIWWHASMVFPSCPGELQEPSDLLWLWEKVWFFYFFYFLSICLGFRSYGLSQANRVLSKSSQLGFSNARGNGSTLTGEKKWQWKSQITAQGGKKWSVSWISTGCFRCTHSSCSCLLFCAMGVMCSEPPNLDHLQLQWHCNSMDLKNFCKKSVSFSVQEVWVRHCLNSLCDLHCGCQSPHISFPDAKPWFVWDRGCSWVLGLGVHP